MTSELADHNETSPWLISAESWPAQCKPSAVSTFNGMLLHGRRALWNLTKARPSTAPIGNDAVMAALRQLGADRGEEVAVWKFMSASELHAVHAADTFELHISNFFDSSD